MPLIPVTDASDPRLEDYRGLTDVALRRRLEPERGLYMAEGAKVIERALAAGAEQVAPPTRTPWGSLNARLEGPAGLQLTLFQQIDPE